MRQLKLGYLDFSSLYSGQKEFQNTLIDKKDRIQDLTREKSIVENALGFKLDKITDSKFRGIVTERFGDVDTFLSVFREVESFVQETEITSNTEPPIDEEK